MRSRPGLAAPTLTALELLAAGSSAELASLAAKMVKAHPECFNLPARPLAAVEAEAAAERAQRRGPEIPLEHRLEVVNGFRTEGGFGFTGGQVVDERDKRLRQTIATHPECFVHPRRPLA